MAHKNGTMPKFSKHDERYRKYVYAIANYYMNNNILNAICLH